MVVLQARCLWMGGFVAAVLLPCPAPLGSSSPLCTITAGNGARAMEFALRPVHNLPFCLSYCAGCCPLEADLACCLSACWLLDRRCAPSAAAELVARQWGLGCIAHGKGSYICCPNSYDEVMAYTWPGCISLMMRALHRPTSGCSTLSGSMTECSVP